MSVEVEHYEAEEQEREYPWVGQSEDGTVVLFVGHSQGIVLRDDSEEGASLGDSSDDWDEVAFVPLYGEVKITTNVFGAVV